MSVMYTIEMHHVHAVLLSCAFHGLKSIEPYRPRERSIMACSSSGTLCNRSPTMKSPTSIVSSVPARISAATLGPPPRGREEGVAAMIEGWWGDYAFTMSVFRPLWRMEAARLTWLTIFISIAVLRGRAIPKVFLCIVCCMSCCVEFHCGRVS